MLFCVSRLIHQGTTWTQHELCTCLSTISWTQKPAPTHTPQMSAGYFSSLCHEPHQPSILPWLSSNTHKLQPLWNLLLQQTLRCLQSAIIIIVFMCLTILTSIKLLLFLLGSHLFLMCHWQNFWVLYAPNSIFPINFVI